MSVVALPGFSVPAAEPVEEVVAILEAALEGARSGKIVGVALVSVSRDPLMFETRIYGAHMSRHTVAAGVLSMSYQIGKLLSDD